jgi:hypothetical protein
MRGRTCAESSGLAPAIRVNGIAPGLVPTEVVMTALETDLPALEKMAESHIPLKRLGTPDDMAAAAIYLASDAGSWVTGQIISVSGGLWVLPDAEHGAGWCWPASARELAQHLVGVLAELRRAAADPPRAHGELVGRAGIAERATQVLVRHRHLEPARFEVLVLERLFG